MAKANWNKVGTGAYSIILASPSGVGTKAIRMTTAPATSDEWIFNGSAIATTEMLFWQRSITANITPRVHIRSQSNLNINNSYRLATAYSGGLVDARIYKVIAGVATLLISNTSPSTSGTWRWWRWRMKGYAMTLDIWNAGTLVWDVVLNYVDGLSTYASGYPAFGNTSTGAVASVVDYDDVDIGDEL